MRAAWLVSFVLLSPSALFARTVMILPFEPTGATQAETDGLDGYFRDAAAAELSGVHVVTKAEMEQLLSVAGGKVDLSPLALVRLTPMTGADAYVTGHVGSDAVGLKATLRLINATSGAEEKRVERSVLRTGTDPAAGMLAAAVEMLQPAAFRGSLEVVCARGGVTVIIGTDEQGECTGTKLVNGLVPGSHVLRLRKQGFIDGQRRLEVAFRRVTVARVTETAAGFEVDVDSETRAEEGSMAPVPVPASPETTGAAPGKTSSGGASPLVPAGVVVAVVGGVVALVGVVGVITGSVATVAWPRDRGAVLPLGFEVTAGGSNAAALVMTRVWGTLALAVATGVLGLVGLGILVGGVAAAVAGLAMRGE